MLCRKSFWILLSALAILPEAGAQDTRYPPKGQLIPPPDCFVIKGAWEGGDTPCTSAVYRSWLKNVKHWRFERKIRIGYDGSRYSKPALEWTQSSFIQPQMMVQDRYFYDPVARRYTVDRYLDDLQKRYGGIDAVLIWPTYPNMGIDNRNQHDTIRAMPGGIAGVKSMIADFHRRGVRVLFPMMMWDQGTRDPGKPWPQEIAEFMKDIDADGINGDTQDGVPLAFSEAAEKAGHPLAFEPEGSPSDEALAWNVMTWGQYSGQFTFAPGLDRFRWLEPRHMVNISDRWNAAKPTIYSSLSSTAKVGRVGRISGAFGTALRRAMERRHGAWLHSNGAWPVSSSVTIGNRSTRCSAMECLQAAGRWAIRLSGRLSIATNMT